MTDSTTDPNERRRRRPSVSGHILATVLGTAVTGFTLVSVGACAESDPFGLNNWVANPDSATIFSLSLENLNLASAFDFAERAVRPVAVRDELGRFNNWDVALDLLDGELVLLPQPALGIISEAAIVEMPNIAFSAVLEAPADTLLYQTLTGVTLRTSSVYVVRTRQVSRPSFFTSVCVYYAKLQPLRVDPVEGILEFLYDVNAEFSGCNNRDLVPPPA